MHEDVTAVVAGDKAEALVGVVPLDLAGRQGEALQKLVRMEVGEVDPTTLPVAAALRRHGFKASRSGRRQPGPARHLTVAPAGLKTFAASDSRPDARH